MPRPLVLASLLLLDVWSWDDHLPPGEGVGSQVSYGGDTVEVVGWDGASYRVARVFQVPVTRIRPLDGGADEPPGYPLVAGLTVRADGVPATILSSDGTTLTVRQAEPRPAPGLRVPNEDDVEIPLVSVLGGLALLVAIGTWTIRLNALMRRRVR